MSRPIDTEHLEKYVSGDDALRDEILTIFQEQIEMLREKIDVNADDEDWYNTMHAMKGASRGVGAWAVGDICEAAEAYTNSHADKISAREKALEALNVKLDDTIEDARKLRDGK